MVASMGTVRLRGDLAVIRDGDATLLIGDEAAVALPDPRAARVLRALRSAESLAEVLDRVPADCRGYARSLMDALAGAGLAGAFPDPRPPTGWDAYAEVTGAGWQQAREALATTLVGVAGGGAEWDTSLRSALTQAGVRRASRWAPGDHTDLVVASVDDYLSGHTDDLVRRITATGAPVLLARPSGTTAWLGPILGPPGTKAACWACTRERMVANRPAAAGSATVGDIPYRRPESIGMGLAMAGLAAHAATQFRIHGDSPLTRAMWTMDGRDLSVTHHRVVPVPECAACGRPGELAGALDRPVRLVARSAVAGESSGRAASPEDTFARYEHLISPITGIVPGVHPDPRAPEGMHVFLSGSNVAAERTGARGSVLRWDSAGKGETAMQARVGALAEALERRSGVWRGHEGVLTCRIGNAPPEAIHPDTIQLFSEAQFRERSAGNRRHSPFQRVPRPVTDDTRLAWSRCWSLRDGTPALVPAGLAYSRGPNRAFLTSSSNGCASGASLEDAVLQSLLELIERDAVAVWWYNRLQRPEVDLGCFDDPWLRAVRTRYRERGRDLWVLDLTHDLGIPVAVAVSMREDPHAPAAIFGFGAATTMARAARRSITEMNQFLAAITDAAPDAIAADPDLRRWLAISDAAGLDYLRPTPSAPRARPADVAGGDITETVRQIGDLLAGRGLDAYVVDQTRADIRIPWSGSSSPAPATSGRALLPGACSMSR